MNARALLDSSFPSPKDMQCAPGSNKPVPHATRKALPTGVGKKRGKSSFQKDVHCKPTQNKAVPHQVYKG